MPKMPSPTNKRRLNRRLRKQRRRQKIHKLIASDLIRRVSEEEYRDKVKKVYGGPQGAFLLAASMISLHVPLGERLFRTRKFDLRGMKSILDVGSGAGQIARHLVKYSDPGTKITCTDLSHPMLRRARTRIKSDIPEFVTADLANMPFADETFDGITCGYVLEHLSDPLPGLTELSRVMRKGGRMLLLTTEDSFGGAWTSRLWHCRTYNRQELMKHCEALNLVCKQELWFTRVHKAIRAGGICVEIEKV